MGFGFKKILDFSAVSLRRLNDQLEMLWIKVMGGIGLSDIDSGFSNTLNEKVDESGVRSIIEQSHDEIILAVGKSSGDNLIKNGNAYFDLNSWQIENVHTQNGFFVVSDGSMIQQGIKVNGGQEHSFGLYVQGEGMLNLTIRAQEISGLVGETLFTQNFEIQGINDISQEINIPLGVSFVTFEISTGNVLETAKIYFRQGSGFSAYTDNPNELHGSGISISENQVFISADNFRLDILGDNGSPQTVLSSSGSGFDKLLCESITIGGRDYYKDNGVIKLYVNSYSGNDANQGTSTYAPFKTINRALKEVPLNAKDGVIIYLTSGFYYEDLIFDYGGSGKIEIMGGNATLYGKIQLKCTNYSIYFNNLKIYATTDAFSTIGFSGYCYFSYCVLDSAKGGIGALISDGACAYFRYCTINNTTYGIFVSNMARAGIYSCLGKGNGTAVVSKFFARVYAYDTIPSSDEYYWEESEEGTITGNFISGNPNEYVEPTAKVMHKDIIQTTLGTYSDGQVDYTRFDQGYNIGALVFVNTAVYNNNTYGLVVKNVQVNIKRSQFDKNVNEAVLHLRDFTYNQSSNTFTLGSDYGEIAKIKRGESIFANLPLSLMNKVTNGSVSGFCFYSALEDEEYEVELDKSYGGILRVYYVQ